MNGKAMASLYIMYVITSDLYLFLLGIHHRMFHFLQDDFSTEELYSECRGDNEFVFLGIYYAENGLIALFSILVAYETQKNLGNYHKYHESAVINLTTILAVLLSSICQVVVIIFRINQIQEGVLLVITLRDCLWMFPMIYLLFIPKVCTVIGLGLWL